ncbi:cytochrome c3 family protein [Tautonia sociabilis]|uniref:cytochrome c3 family protein n=1 Tax=Tautonia sociabilis TaxID=2080755 RepID=UPI0013158C6A|nr:cytochrome c3 family protein [Tautonia sociabilis]
MAEYPNPTGSSPRRPSGKQRAARIPLNYYKTRDGMGRLRLVLVALAPILTLGWWYGGRLLRGDRADSRVSHGPVWGGHAMWEDDCQACHTPFEPIKSGAAFASRGSSRLSGSDQRCSSCHTGPAHHANQRSSLTESCGGCHRDHRGRDADLNRVPDHQCTVCHSDLPHAIQGGPPEDGPLYVDVASFADHPDFGVRVPSPDGRGPLLGRLSDSGDSPDDPSNLKFNHAMHLAVGIDCNFTFADLSPEDRSRYGQTTSTPIDTPVRLDCDSCHLLDAGDRPLPASGWTPSGGDGAIPSRSTGEYMLPVSYENHCRACHPLTVGVPGPGRPPLAIPHGAQPGELRRLLEQAFAAELLDTDRSRLDLPADRPDPDADAQVESQAIDAIRTLLSDADNRLPGPDRRGAETVGDALSDRIRQAEATLYLGTQTCTECHSYDATAGADPSRWTVRPPMVPEVWFPHARFSHVAHRAVDCSQCHGGATDSKVSDDILLAPASSCRDCHGPAEYARGELVRGGARSDCVECHRYHNGDAPLQGIGALARQVDEEQRRSVEAFLRGSAGAPLSGGPSPPSE